MDVHLAQVIIPSFFAPIPEGASGGGTWGGLILFITIAIGLSFLCSVLEAVLLSTTTSYVEVGVQEGKRSASIMQSLKGNVERPISAILTLNTIAHTIGATGAGVEAAGIFGNDATAIIGAVLTLLILVFSEIIPKTLGATYWKQLNGFAAYATLGLVWILFPAVWIFEQMTRIMRPDEAEPTVSRAELETLARIGADEGALQAEEGKVLTNLFHLRKVQVKDIMTPRTVILAFQQNMTVGEVVENTANIPYSRLPIYNEDRDDIVGFVLRHDIFNEYANDNESMPILKLRRDIIAMPESASVSNALNELTAKREHISVVIDEYGGTAGILTMEDTIETLLGIEITDESDVVDDLRKMAEDRFERQQSMMRQLGSHFSEMSDDDPSSDDTPSDTPTSPRPQTTD